MLKYFLILFCALPFGAISQSMQASAEIYQFQSADGPYVDIFFYILGSKIKQSPDSRKSVEIKYFIEKGDQVFAGDKYNLVVEALGVSDFMDLRRHSLEPGKYLFRAEIRDNQDSSQIVQVMEELDIEMNDAPGFSDIQLLSHATKTTDRSKWTKNGYDFIPLPFDFIGTDQNVLTVYTELYGSDKLLSDDFYLKYGIISTGAEGKALIEKHKKMSPAAVSPLVQSLDVTGLTTGEYDIHVGAYDREHSLLAEAKTTFTRLNPAADSLMAKNSGKYLNNSFTLKMDADSLRYALKAVAAKISQTQTEALNYLIKKGEVSEQRQYLHSFWRNMDDDDPQQAYADYMEIANYADRVFKSGFGHGFETDRGRIYLRYGAPNDVVSVEDEPSAPPYEIWIYYAFPVTGQSNVKFLFYSPELANSYELLHSTCENEINNPAWEQMLYRDALSETSSGDFIDARPVDDNFVRRAREYFTDF